MATTAKSADKPEVKSEDKTEVKAEIKVTASVASVMTGLSEDQIKDYKKAFDHFDENKNGKICLKEFKEVLKHLELEYTEEETAKLFETADQDDNPDLQLNEFMYAMTHLLTKNPGDIPVVREMKRFERIDKDGNGFISKSELKTVVGKYMPSEVIDEIFKAFDKNGDDEIRIEEFLKANVDYCL